MINLKKEFGKRVRQYRKAMGLSQMKFAEKADITFQTLSSIERGITFPSYPILIKIIETLNVPIVKLFCYDEANVTVTTQLSFWSN
ncbi:TPA: transcriptional regulator [Candidatus Gastranaerophilales bacterium HUM_3]|nr:MAG TPA: transcriptional regulator [Candidatus Gastranaerophilales bacterium HUM_3]